MRKLQVLKSFNKLAGSVFLASCLVGLFTVSPAMAGSMSGGIFGGSNTSASGGVWGGSNTSRSGGVQGSQSTTSAGSAAGTMGHTNLHTQTSGVGPLHSYSGAPCSVVGDKRAGFWYYQDQARRDWGQSSNKANVVRLNATGAANPTPQSRKPRVHNYIGRNASHRGDVTNYSWSINSKLKSKTSISR